MTSYLGSKFIRICELPVYHVSEKDHNDKLEALYKKQTRGQQFELYLESHLRKIVLSEHNWEFTSRIGYILVEMKYNEIGLVYISPKKNTRVISKSKKVMHHDWSNRDHDRYFMINECQSNKEILEKLNENLREFEKIDDLKKKYIDKTLYMIQMRNFDFLRMSKDLGDNIFSVF